MAMSFTRRDFVYSLSGLIAACTVSAAQAQAPDELIFAPTRDDGLGEAIKKALSSGKRRVRLLDGDYGPQTIQGIAAENFEIVGSGKSVVNMTMITASAGISFRKVIFQGEKSDLGSGMGLVYVNRDASHTRFSKCTFRTTEDTSSWQPRDWVELPYNSGLLARGKNVVVADCDFTNLRNCLTFLDCDDSSAENCRFQDFGNDGVEFGGSNIRIVGNTIRGSHHTDAENQHSDGIQGFPAPNKRIYENIEITGNLIEYVGPGDYMQGISIFDGRWKDVRVSDNTIEVNMWNAIALYGIDGVTVERNTVRSKDNKRPSWIEVRASKDGRNSSNIVARDNHAPTLRIPTPR
ncbi:hypothetical protein ASG25_02915 [Rhizobium sp. Leaf384]|nr:hypothetical protein ASG25_02915 [Rhizobium sp. Leaf384]KQS86601.1 hypothetical protein ASG58_17990 [Rhizobium sp. Leaf383]